MKENLFNYSTKELINKYQLLAEKKFGQNFIINHSLTHKIAAALEQEKPVVILEIGPGPACLTREIIALKPQKLFLIELDNKFKKFLKDLKATQDADIELIFADVLKLDFSEFGNEFSIISNLPYNISSPFLVKAMQHAEQIPELILMLQKEFAERLLATTGSKNFSRLAVLVQSFYDVKKVVKVSKKAFYPEPKIDSLVLHFKYNRKLPADLTIAALEEVSKNLFAARRKKLNSFFKKYQLKLEHIDSNKRAEDLTLAEIYDVVRAWQLLK